MSFEREVPLRGTKVWLGHSQKPFSGYVAVSPAARDIGNGESVIDFKTQGGTTIGINLRRIIHVDHSVFPPFTDTRPFAEPKDNSGYIDHGIEEFDLEKDKVYKAKRPIVNLDSIIVSDKEALKRNNIVAWVVTDEKGIVTAHHIDTIVSIATHLETQTQLIAVKDRNGKSRLLPVYSKDQTTPVTESDLKT